MGILNFSSPMRVLWGAVVLLGLAPAASAQEGAGPGAAGSQWLHVIAEALLTDDFLWIWCGIIISWAGLMGIGLFRKSRRLQRALRNAIAGLASFQDPTEFTHGLEEYGQAVSSSPLLKGPWTEFRRSLVVPAQGEPGAVLTTDEPGRHLSDDTLGASQLSLGFYASVPSHLTAFGILGTFLGLAAGVHVAAGNLSASDPDVVKQALSQLLNGASLAFITSVVGLSCSLVFLIFERSAVAKLRRVRHDWAARLEQLVLPLSMEKLQFDQLEYAKEQTRQLKAFNDELRFSIEQALEERVAGRLAPLLERLDGSLQGLRQDRSTEAGAAIEDMLERFLAAMNQRTNEEFGSVKSALSEAADTLRSSAEVMSSQLGQAGSSLSAEVGSLLEGLRDGVERLNQTSASLNATIESALAKVRSDVEATSKTLSGNLVEAGKGAAQAMDQSMEGFQQGMKDLQRAAESMHRTVAEVQLAAKEMASVRRTISEAHVHVEQLIEPARALSESVRQSAAQFTAAWRDGREVVAQTQQIAALMAAQQDATAASWEEYRLRFEGIDRSLGRSFQQMSEGLDRYMEKTAEFAKELDEHSSKAIESLGAVMQELSETLSDLEELLPKVRR